MHIETIENRKRTSEIKIKIKRKRERESKRAKDGSLPTGEIGEKAK